MAASVGLGQEVAAYGDAADVVAGHGWRDGGQSGHDGQPRSQGALQKWPQAGQDHAISL
ncbi:MAG: hypothetical protein JF615_08835 [Asticcacaulis sp.]|nr:hypothetical protein [Asticcacaulis sp.]